jgi:hypothetical protein
VTKKKHGAARGRQPQRRQLRSVPPERQHHEDPQQLALLQSLRSGLRSGEPLELLTVVGGLLELTDPRNRDPLREDGQQVSREQLVESFVQTSFAETTAALAAIRALLPAEELDPRIEPELARRRQPVPDWLAGLADARAEPEVWFMTHVLGDGDDYVFGVTLPSGQSLSALVYIDHNLGSVVKDAFVVPRRLEELAAMMGETITDSDQSLTRFDPATARAIAEEAIGLGRHLITPLESETWPACRPVVEWLLRFLPAGGTVPERPEWGDAEIAELTEDFFKSPYGTEFDHQDERSLLESVIWFGTDYGPGDPLRWSPVSVEMLLADWFPRKIVAEPAFLAKLPDLLRAYIRYCHHRNGIRSTLTAETLASVDEWEPEYQRAIRSARRL